jgi:thiamine monophosphate kinase
MKESDEFSILEKYFKSLGNQFYDSSGILIGPGDDAGLFSQKKSDLIFSTDLVAYQLAIFLLAVAN